MNNNNRRISVSSTVLLGLVAIWTKRLDLSGLDSVHFLFAHMDPRELCPEHVVTGVLSHFGLKKRRLVSLLRVGSFRDETQLSPTVA